MLFTACSSSKKAITSSDFQSKAAARSLYTQDNTSTYDQYDYVESCITAASYSGDQIFWKMDFLEASSMNEAALMYNSNVQTFESISGASTSIKLNNYGKYEKTGNGKFMYVSYLENTMIYVNADEQYKDEIKEFIDAIGY